LVSIVKRGASFVVAPHRTSNTKFDAMFASLSIATFAECIVPVVDITTPLPKQRFGSTLITGLAIFACGKKKRYLSVKVLHAEIKYIRGMADKH
jgi:hypothetical protein